MFILETIEFIFNILPAVLWFFTIAGILSGILVIIGAILDRKIGEIFTGIGLVILGAILVQLLRGA